MKRGVAEHDSLALSNNDFITGMMHALQMVHYYNFFNLNTNFSRGESLRVNSVENFAIPRSYLKANVEVNI